MSGRETITIPAEACLVRHYILPLPCGVYGTTTCARCRQNPFRDKNKLRVVIGKEPGDVQVSEKED